MANFSGGKNRMQITKFDMDTVFNKLNLQIRSTKHKYGWLIINGKKILRVHFSHGRGNIPQQIANKIRGQLKLSNKNFENLIKCPLDYEEYIQIIKDKGMLD